MDAAAPKTLDNHSHVVRPAEMEWKKTCFPGCEVKGLLLDQQTGLVTALMRLGPGAVLPDSNRPTCSKASWSIKKALWQA
jgi:hypothetical protein